MNFEATRDLNTVQIQDTILFKAGDDDKGAAPFIRIWDSMIGKRGPFIPRFEAKWLVSDITQLRHVIRETKVRARGLYNTLSAHATVAVAEASGELHQQMTQSLNEIDARNYKLFTAFHSNDEFVQVLWTF